MGSGEALRVRFDTFELDEADARLKRNGVPIALAPKAFAVLCTLARQPGALVTKNALLDAVWGHRHVSESVLKTTISELRTALADDAKQPRYIETASRRGYRFIALAPSAAVTSASTAVAPSDRSTTPSFIGRERALAHLHESWQRACGGERQLVWLAGEAGIGKSRLIDAFIRELGDVTVTTGQCVEHFGTSEPYLPILEAIKELCRDRPELVQEMRAVAPTWLVQMPWLVSDAERASLHAQVVGAHQDRMVREMRELMDRFTAKRPLLFVLEDLHWSDLGTLRMMDHFARRPRQVRLMWIASFRLTQIIAEDHALRELRQELKLHRLCDEILLEPFSETEVDAYVRTRLPDLTLPESMIKRIHDHTEGLPLYVTNVLDSMLAQAAANATPLDQWLAGTARNLPIPDSLAGIIEKQIGRLPPEVRTMLEAASVCGVEFRAGIVAQMLVRDVQWVNERCEELERRQFWLRHLDIVERADGDIDSRYGFLHAVYRHVFYQRMSVPQRVQWHRQAARALDAARQAGDIVLPVELASHYERGHQPMLSARFYAEAARYAFAHFAPREAIELITKAQQQLERCADGTERWEIELTLMHTRGLASAQLFGVGAPETYAAFDRTRELGEKLPETPARALLLNGMGLSNFVRGNYPPAIALTHRVEAIGEKYSDQVLLMFACLLRGIVLTMQGHFGVARQTLERGIAICEAAGARIPVSAFIVDPTVALHMYLTISLLNLGCAEQARRHVAAARARTQQTNQPTSRMLLYWLEASIELRYGNVARVTELVEQLTQVVETNMLSQGEGPKRWLRGWVLAHTGSPREGYALIREGYEMQVQLGMYGNKTEVLGFSTEALILAGDWDGAEREIEAALALAERIGEDLERTTLWLLRARVWRGKGDFEREEACIVKAIDDAHARGLPYHELRSINALIDAGRANDEHRARLKTVYAALPECLDMPAPRRAAELLGI